MKPSPWPDWLVDSWAKSSTNGKQPGESLADHTWLVLERLAELARLHPHLATYLNAPRLWHCLFWACFLHDFGKAAFGFQTMVRGGEKWKRRHEVLSLAFLDWITPNFSQTEQKWILAAIVSHHRDAKEITSTYDKRVNQELVEEMLGQLDEMTVRGIWRWLYNCSNSWIDALDLRQFGVQSVSLVDETMAVQMLCIEGTQRTKAWLSSYRRFITDQIPSERDLRIVTTLVMLRGLTTTADHMASAHLPHVPTGIQRSWEQFAYEELKIKTYHHQRMSAINHDTSAMLVAPTGSGKTEAALFWAMGDGSQPASRIFYALPYQASMNAMYDRLRSPLYFGDASVGLQHGRALQALHQRLMNSERGPKSAIQEAKWRKNLTQLHACPVKVFSPYQMLKVVYQIKGFEGMLTDYTQAAFIFDEIHAYDPGRLAIILCLVRHLREHFGARFFIMSATFPKTLQDIMSEIIDIKEPIIAEKELFEQFRRHHLQLLDGDLLAHGVNRIVIDVQMGKSVLVCCNTVRRAQEIHEQLLLMLPPEQVELIHSRFTLGDRLNREKAIFTRCNVDAEHTALAVVATQVVEVSLNIDLDTIYSDPAPLEALVQRFGRINRARKKGIVPVHVFRQPDDGQYVYNDKLVKKTLEVLEAHNDQDIDEAVVSEWLNDIYQNPEIYNPWKKQYDDQYQLVARLLLDLRPFDSNEKSEQEFEKLFDGVEVLPGCFEREYVSLITQDEFIEASQLFVSISQKKYQQLAKQGKIRMLGDDRHKRWLVMQPYSSEHGLLFDTSSGDRQDGD